MSINILIPAHNEAELIGATLTSIERSIEYLQASHAFRDLPKVSVSVGADECIDQTARIARQFAGVSVTEFPGYGNKWATLKALLAESSAEWTILVDAGTVWPAEFLEDFVRQASRTCSAIAIAPSYRPLNAGRLAQLIWRTEKWLKNLESVCGGPVSLHGATVGYQTPPLMHALASLGENPWLNDDVVIPLMLRALYPTGVILYPIGEIQDAGIQNGRSDLARRKRMLQGNLHWMATLLPVCFRFNPVAGLLALRRLFRVFWAWWLGFLILGAAIAYHMVLLVTIALGILVIVSGSFRQLAGAAVVSLSAPLRLGHSRGAREEAWE